MCLRWYVASIPKSTSWIHKKTKYMYLQIDLKYALDQMSLPQLQNAYEVDGVEVQHLAS